MSEAPEEVRRRSAEATTEPAPEAGAGRLGLSRAELMLRGVGLALVGAGLAARFVSEDRGMQLGGWCVAMLGAAFALFGHEPRARIRAPLTGPDLSEPRPEPRAIRHLAVASGVATAAGVIWVSADALSTRPASTAWVLVACGVAGLVVAGVWKAEHGARPRAVRVDWPESRRSRRLIAGAVVVALLVQLAIPLRYYLGDDPFDERFAWRMFSAIRVSTCSLQALDVRDGRRTPVQLNRHIHVAWITTMKRNREDVLQRYLRWRCATEAGLDGARVLNRCVSPQGERLPDNVREIDCASGEVVAVEVQ